MKRFSIISLLLLVIAFAFAENRGTLVTFPDAKPQGAQYKPQMGIGVNLVSGKEVPYLIIRLTGNQDYSTFDSSSRILIRFVDGTKVVLPRLENDKVQKEASNNVIGGATFSYYRTYTHYQLDKSFIDKLTSGTAIIKVRVVLSAENAKDYDIDEKYGAKITEMLQKSYSEASLLARKNNTVLSDDDF